MLAEYEEKIRRFLMGTEFFPKIVCLMDLKRRFFRFIILRVNVLAIFNRVLATFPGVLATFQRVMAN
jgi:hypothetical protein